MPETIDAQEPGGPLDEDCAPSTKLRPGQPQPARVYNALLGGKDNFPADREAAEQALLDFPTLKVTARENRLFLARAVRYCAQDEGIRQFLDIGTGIPAQGSTHEIAQAIAGEEATRVVYVDNDPIVLVHARALLQGAGACRTFYLEGDLRDPQPILSAARAHLDFDRPIALLLVAVLHFVEDSDDPYGIVRQLLDALPAGSLLVLSHATGDYRPAEARRLVATYRERGMSAQARSRTEVDRFVQGLEIVAPGVQTVSRWRPDPGAEQPRSADVSCFGVIARKPGPPPSTTASGDLT
ncbi:SAM-dependent methyltransferase [Streptacidiphilus sp. MAP5-52]|uniref:SAM-dependent methyltransferase n=1 Tax=Streptacidiphilus sp. MAP5-52 TaxID=3156267 RepID=UPI003511FBC2